MKKSLNIDNNGSTSDCSNNNNNWLGFSLSPHMKMESLDHHHHHHHHQFNHHQNTSSSFYNNTTTSVPLPPTSFCLSSTTQQNNSLCFGLVADNNVDFPLSILPVKSDGSLCFMDSIPLSQPPQGLNSSPKLENFLDRESVQNFDSIFNRQQISEHLQLIPFGEEYMQHQYFSGLQQYHNIYQTTEESNETHHLPDDQNWVDKCYIQQNNLVVDDVVVSAAAVSASGLSCGELQSLSLSMSPGSQSSCVTTPRNVMPLDAVAATTNEYFDGNTKKRSCEKVGSTKPTVHRKSIDTFGQRTSQYRGVTRHRWTGRYEAHLWDNSCKKEGQSRKGRQVYLGGYDMEDKAARAYDLAALKYWGSATHINFPVENYQQELEEMKNMNRQEYVAHLRRRSSGFSRGASIYRGVTRHHQHGRWQARIGRVAGNKDLYLGTFSTQEEAAEAYDIAAIKFRGLNAVTNFDISRYNVEKIMASNTLPSADLARRNKSKESNVEPTNVYPLAAQQTGSTDLRVMDCETALYQPVPLQAIEPFNVGNPRNSFCTTALQDLVGMAPIVDESGKIGAHFSNSSSLVTSLNSSREASPDRTNGASMFYGKPSAAATSSGSWISSTQQRTLPISMAHVPVFAAWADI